MSATAETQCADDGEAAASADQPLGLSSDWMLVDERKFQEQQLGMLAFHAPFDVTSWYKKLEDHTFPTLFVPVTPAQALVICKLYRCIYFNEGAPLDEQQSQEIAALYLAIDEAISKAPPSFQDDGFFVRMISRSSKDSMSALAPNTLSQLFQQEFSTLNSRQLLPASHSSMTGSQPNNNSDDNDNDDDEEEECGLSEPMPADVEQANLGMVALARAQFRFLRVTNAEDVVERLVKSERVYSDLLRALDAHALAESTWNQCVCLRKWEPRLRDDLEFRCFVHRRRLVAISQYNQYCIFPGLESLLDATSALLQLQRFVDTVSHLITAPDYVIDVAMLIPASLSRTCSLFELRDFLLGEKSSFCLKFIAIEINPFAHTTGPALFSWKEPVLAEPPVVHPHGDPREGQRPQVVVRIRQDNHPDIVDLYRMSLQELQEPVLPPFWSFLTIDQIPQRPPAPEKHERCAVQ